MKKLVIIILSVATIFGGMFVFYQNRPAKQGISPAAEQTGQQTNARQNWESKTDNQAEVSVTVTPIDVSAQSIEWKFNVVISTHSVELDHDMVKIGVLIDEQGKEYKALRWEGTPPGGHHREGVLVFEQIKSNPKLVELKISGIGNVVRSFSWQNEF